ncbi:MAG: asparaginase domain-containing protein [Acutalibacteraceae bacterium]|nr:asparaginase domain-containing protein [Acutalibacteraceae bacterium]
MKKIFLILTGGTICSSENSDGKRESDAKSAELKIINNFRQSNSPFNSVQFETRMPLDILSENMTIDRWNILLDELRATESEKYNGIIILHGTDTLAYTASLLSLVMSEKNLPVCLVSSHSPIDCEGTNANINFRTAVELIMNGLKPNVYAVYENSDSKTYLHYGAHLLQCGNYSNDFFSKDMIAVDNTQAVCAGSKAYKRNNNLLSEIKKLNAKVILTNPYVGLDYNSINLENVSAVVHTTYHSQTVCVDGDNNSFAEFAKRCKKEGVSLILTPCNKSSCSYVTTAEALSNGVLSIDGLTNETAYIKTLIGCSLGLKENELCEFINTDINSESVY